jgi:acyl-CoA dehydrogenase
MNFAYSDTTNTLQQQLIRFMEDLVAPSHEEWHRQVTDGASPVLVLEELKERAQSVGLWNLFLPGLKDEEPGTRLSNLEYAPLAEIMGRVPWASEVFNCSAPDTGNMELLHLFGTTEQQRQWLVPLLEGKIRSCFAMTEPDVASSDATNIATSIRREGDEYIINGRKWFITGAGHPRCRLSIVLGVTDPNTDTHKRHSMVLVPMDVPEVRVVRDIPVMHHHSPEGHWEVIYDNVRVPATNLLGEEGTGFAMAQARLGPGRIHHCMRSLGQCGVALDLMCQRSLERKTFGGYLHEHGTVAEWIALSRLEIEQARLLVLKAAWLIDTQGNRAARNDVSMIKLIVPRIQVAIAHRAIQTFGAEGLSPDTPLAELWTTGRLLQIADGPDEVHLRTIARREIKRARSMRAQAMVWPFLAVQE